MRSWITCLVLVLAGLAATGCQRGPQVPKPLSVDQERQLQQKIEQSRQAESGSIPRE
jgi:hypothetical protein